MEINKTNTYKIDIENLVNNTKDMNISIKPDDKDIHLNIDNNNILNDMVFSNKNKNFIKGTFIIEKDTVKQKELLNNIEELNLLINKVKQGKKKFVEKSRLYCCTCSALCTLLLLLVFYIFDVVKYNDYCKGTLTSVNNVSSDDDNLENGIVEFCEAPAISFGTRMSIIIILVGILILSLYCTGKTILIFDPINNLLSIDKKKLFCLPSVNYYCIDDLEEAIIESDVSTFDGPRINTFNFYSVTLVFKNEKVGLGFGRDCFFLYHKLKLKSNINKYLDVLNTKEMNYTKEFVSYNTCNNNNGDCFNDGSTLLNKDMNI